MFLASILLALLFLPPPFVVLERDAVECRLCVHPVMSTSRVVSQLEKGEPWLQLSPRIGSSVHSLQFNVSKQRHILPLQLKRMGYPLAPFVFPLLYKYTLVEALGRRGGLGKIRSGVLGI